MLVWSTLEKKDLSGRELIKYLIQGSATLKKPLTTSVLRGQVKEGMICSEEKIEINQQNNRANTETERRLFITFPIKRSMSEARCSQSQPVIFSDSQTWQHKPSAALKCRKETGFRFVLDQMALTTVSFHVITLMNALCVIAYIVVILQEERVYISSPSFCLRSPTVLTGYLSRRQIHASPLLFSFY